MKNIYQVKDDFTEMRLDKWIKKNISDIPQSLIEKNIRKGNIKINSKKKRVHINLKKMIKLFFIILIFIPKNIKIKPLFIRLQKVIYLIHQT